MPDGPVVSNNSPLVALWVLDRLDLLRDLFGTVLIPNAVREEFLAAHEQHRPEALAGAPWIETRPLRDPRRALPFTGLDLGEAEVLALAEEVDARLVILDERKGRRYARRLGRGMIGTVGLLLLAKEKNLLEGIAGPLRRLEEAGLHLGSKLTEEALRRADELNSSES